MTRCVYAAEDLFGRLPLHWSWWPAIGGVVVGVGGLVDPRVLGVGYETIGDELAGRLARRRARRAAASCKLVVWAIALGSNTSGGILAPLLMLGAALGGLARRTSCPGADRGPGRCSASPLRSPASRARRSRASCSPSSSPTTSTPCSPLLARLRGRAPAQRAGRSSARSSPRRSPGAVTTSRASTRSTRSQALFVRDVMATDVLTVAPDDHGRRAVRAAARGLEHRASACTR